MTISDTTANDFAVDEPEMTPSTTNNSAMNNDNQPPRRPNDASPCSQAQTPHTVTAANGTQCHRGPEAMAYPEFSWPSDRSSTLPRIRFPTALDTIGISCVASVRSFRSAWP